MKCPYQTITIHKPEYSYGYIHRYAKDIVEFSDCVGSECPFYSSLEGCIKAKKELENE